MVHCTIIPKQLIGEREEGGTKGGTKGERREGGREEGREEGRERYNVFNILPSK